ncbi:hypothetical protein C0580_02310 [Candidatus Parcubacteria bacterium]|nr:MAG: hypothetical protein C0580_02310 [Candidatus Parcubacteria bacterium]
MSIENPFENQGHEDGVEKEISIESTTSFQEAIANGSLEQAETWLEEAKNLEQYDDRWLDHRERDLFKAYYQAEDWIGAKRIVEKTKNPDSQAGRKARLEELSGMKYEEI